MVVAEHELDQPGEHALMYIRSNHDFLFRWCPGGIEVPASLAESVIAHFVVCLDEGTLVTLAPCTLRFSMVHLLLCLGFVSGEPRRLGCFLRIELDRFVFWVR
jgi:hypothetical protein